MSKLTTFKNMFGKLFNKEKVETSEKPKLKEKSLYDTYLETKKDIKYLEDKYDDFIVRSLEVEFEQYKNYVDENYPNIPSRSFDYWMFSEIKYDSFTLRKSDKHEIKLEVRYEFYQDQWKLKNVSVRIEWDSTTLDVDKLNKIVFKYFIYWKLKEVEKDKETKKNNFQKMIDVIGKDVKRDSIIDQILS